MRPEPVGTAARSSSDVLGEGFLSFLLATGACLCPFVADSLSKQTPPGITYHIVHICICACIYASLCLSLSLSADSSNPSI